MSAAGAATDPVYRQMIVTFDGRQVDGGDVADCYDPACPNACDLGLLTFMAPFARGKALVPTTEVCSCAIARWQKANPKFPKKERTDGA